MNNYKSAVDYQQEKLDLQRQKTTSESFEEREAIDEEIRKITDKINWILNQCSDWHIIWYN